MKTIDVEKVFPTPQISKEQPQLLGDSYIFVIKRDDLTKKLYDSFYENYELYLSKLPPNYCTKSCMTIYENDALFLGINVKNQKIALTGRIIVSEKKLHGVVLDIVELDLFKFENNDRKINTDKIDEAVYSTYFQINRAACFLNRDRLKNDNDLIKLIVEYYLRLLLKIFSKINHINEKQKSIMTFLITYFIYRFLLGYSHPIAYERTFADERFKPFEIEFKDKLTILSKFQQFNDLFTGLNYFGVISATASAMNLSLIQVLQPIVYFSITSSIDNLVAVINCSKYPSMFFRRGFVDNNIQSQIEEIIYRDYISKIDIDISPLKGFIDKFSSSS